MFEQEGLKAFTESVRLLDESVKNIKLSKVELDGKNRSITYKFICDKTVSEDVVSRISDYCLSFTPASFSEVKAEVKKIVADEELVQRKIYDIILSEYPSMTVDFSEEDITVKKAAGYFSYTLNLIPSSADYCKKNKTLEAIDERLNRSFCDIFKGEMKEKAVPEAKIPSVTSVNKNDLITVSRRYLTVSDVEVIDDKFATDTALYIDDAVVAGDYTLAGKIIGIKKKETEKGKPFYIFDFSDKTGKIGGIYFTKKNTIDKIAALKEGDDIIAKCTLGYYKERLSLTINRINKCRFPEDFVPKKKEGNPAPENYTLVFPEKLSTYNETSMFDDNAELPEDLKNNDFVVFDLETTGKVAGEDCITEIGAVKIIKGVIAESFHTLVKSPKPIPDEIVSMTGITNEMIKNAPEIKDVIPDFFKFTRNAILVAHNSDFDMKFIKIDGEKYDYHFDNKVIDTVTLAIKNLKGVKNYKLNTLAEYYKIDFNHHRGDEDALCTAQIFINLMKIQKFLPEF